MYNYELSTGTNIQEGTVSNYKKKRDRTSEQLNSPSTFELRKSKHTQHTGLDRLVYITT